MANNHIILYSTNTWLAWAIAEQYYKGSHYCWCSPVFDSSKAASISARNPPTSSPAEIARGLKNDVERSDLHSAKIAENRLGILAGANKKHNDGVISRRELHDIALTVGSAQIFDFRPVIFVIPANLTTRRLSPVAVGVRAHPMSTEYLIKKISRKFFDVIELPF